jgi:cytochrome c oxidase cbb3-type subunit III|tara:strand:- start:746 stop:1357 length:612 start_codon:yes stop_codon:yes gene_type:complete
MADPTKNNTEAELLEHNYDGIQEYDNPTPGWWHLIFWGTIIWSVIYVVVWHLTPLIPTRVERLEATETKAVQKQFAALMTIDDNMEKIRTIMGDENWLAQGQSVFSGTCTLCHGQNGEGLIGPNLTDEFYKNLVDLDGMVNVVTNGAANGAMPANKNLLSENEIALVVGYVASLRGQNLPGPRGVEGEEIEPFPEPISADQGG